MRAVTLMVAAAACSSAPGTATPAIEAVSPDHGPLVGGTRVVVTGSGFAGDMGGTRAFVAGREAPLAATIDDATVEVVIPPGDRPGDAEVIVINRNGNAIASGVFRYSTEPTITAVEPAELVYTETATAITVTGSGFAEEGAGDAIVLVDGVPAMDVVVRSDSELVFTAPGGRALGRPQLEVVNTRGLAVKPRAFRYRPSARSGLLLFPRSSQLYAVFFDPTTGTRVDIPRVGPFTATSTVIVDDTGEYWGTESGRIGRLDLGSQRLEQTVPIQFRLPAMVRAGGEHYGIDRISLRFGRVGLDGTFTPIGDTALPCCGGSWGIAFDGTTVYYTSRAGADRTINTIDRATGAIGTPVPLIGGPSLHVEELRFFAGALYATSRDGTLVTIDPSTGVTAVVATIPRSNAMEVFE